MIDREHDRAKPTRAKPPLTHSDQGENLPYRIEVWNSANDAVERVLARATNAQLARAIFNAAQNENPGRRLTVRRGSKIILDSAAAP